MSTAEDDGRPTVESFADEVPDYYLNALSDFRQHGTFLGLRVLEIGGSALPRRLVFDALGARQLVCVDIINHASGAYQQSEHAAHYAEVGIEPLTAAARPGTQRYQIFDGSAADIPAGFFGQFDVVFSINAFEHVVPLERVVERAHKALRPGGLLFSQFGPIWSCEVGSHFWVRPDFCFNAPDPMPPWAHLRYTREQLADLLRAAGIDGDDLHQALYQLYESGFVNRRFFEEYEAVMATSPFATSSVEGLWHRPVPEAMQAELERRHPGRRDFAAYGIRIVARRAALPGHRVVLAMPRLAKDDDDNRAPAAALEAAARAVLGEGLWSRVTADLPAAVWPLLPWPDAVLQAVASPGETVPDGWAGLFVECWCRETPDIRLQVHLQHPVAWAQEVLLELYGDGRFGEVALPPDTLWEAWCQHARRLLGWMARGIVVECVVDDSCADAWPLSMPESVCRHHEALLSLANALTSPDDPSRGARAAVLLQELAASGSVG